MLQDTLHVFLARLTVAQQHNFQITTLIISAKLCFFVPMLPSLLLPGARDVSAALFIFLTIEWPCGAKKHSLNLWGIKGFFLWYLHWRYLFLRLLIAQFTYLCFCVVVMPWRQYPVWVTSCAVLLSLLLDLFSSQVYLGSFFSIISLGLEKTCRIRGVITDRLFDYSQNRWSRNLNVPVFCCC